MRPVDLAHGVATSIGSLPHTDPRAAARFVLERQARLPAAPSLPNRSPAEGMLGQGAWGIAGVDVSPDGTLRADVDQVDGTVAGGIDGEPFVALRAFLDAVRGRRGPIKLQVTGPLTLGTALVRAGLPAEVAFEVAATAVRVRSGAVIDAANAAAPDSPLVVFVDEPSLTAAMDPSFPLRPERSIDLVSGALAAIEPHAVTGLHCCGPADWRLVLQAGPQILSLPVGADAAAHAGAVGAFVERGGWVAWGAVPTGGPLGSTADRLWRALSAEWCALVQGGCEPVLLRERSLVTPACGLAGHSELQAEQVLSLTAQVARRLETQTLGLRLTVGA